MDNPKFRVRWIDRGMEPKNPPNPRFPKGKPIDLRTKKDAPSCFTDLPYPSPRCGYLFVLCLICGENALITTAGRVDDPCSVTMECKLH